MNKPTVLAILSAFEKTVKPGIDDGCSPFDIEKVFTGLQAAFLCELEPLITAHKAEQRSREIALGELSRAIGEGVEWLIDSGLRSETDDDKRATFNAICKPWLDRLKS